MRYETNLQTGEKVELEDAPSAYIPPTQAEIEAQKDANALELNESKKAFAAILEILWDNSAELRAAFPTKEALKQAAVAAYRAKL